MIFVMDSSGSISENNHGLQQNFINEVACSFDIDDSKTRFGIAIGLKWRMYAAMLLCLFSRAAVPLYLRTTSTQVIIRGH